MGRGHPVITPVIEQFAEGSGGSEATTYFAIPHYLTTEQHSVFLHNTKYRSLILLQMMKLQLKFILRQSLVKHCMERPHWN